MEQVQVQPCPSANACNRLLLYPRQNEWRPLLMAGLEVSQRFAEAFRIRQFRGVLQPKDPGVAPGR